jgi:hypothetical protein
MPTKRTLYLTIILALVLLTACTRPIGKAPSAIPSAAYTQAVQTVVAKLTVTPGAPAMPAASPTPAPSKTAVVEAIDTPVPATDTAEPEATATTAASPVVPVNPSDPLSGLGNPDWHEGFDGTAVWYAFEDEFVRFQSVGNKLEMTAFQANNRNGWALAPYLLSDKYYVEMTATFTGACKGSDHFGMMISPVSSADRGYLLGIACDGKFVLWKWDGTRMTPLANWKESDEILGGANKTNRIGMKVDGNKLGLYANGVLMKEVTDVSYEKFYFGVFIGAAETAGFKVNVSSLNYWKLP